jgi:hypothetical protein
MRNSRRLWGAIALCVLASPAFAGLFAPASLSGLQRRADLIVVGGVTSAFSGPSSLSFSIQVDRVIKGDAALVGSAVPVSWSAGASTAATPGQAIAVNCTGLWFLQQSPSGWVLLPVVNGDARLEQTLFPVPAGSIVSAYAYQASAPVSDKVASEIGSSIESGTVFDALEMYALFGGQLDELQSAVVPLLYQRLSGSASARLRVLGASGLLRGGSGAALASAVQLAPTLSAYPLEGGILLSSLRDYYRTSDATAVASLGQAAADSSDPNAAFREAAGHALAAIHTAAALPYLASLLDDPDTLLRTEAIRGIGSFANGLPVQTAAGVPGLMHLQLPAAAPYRTDDTMRNFALGPDVIGNNLDSYRQFWKQWWSANHAALGY